MNSNQTQLDTVKQAFDEWRTNRPKMEKIPLYLWEMVKPLMNEYPIAMVSRALGLNYAQLKENTMEQQINFVEAMTTASDTEQAPAIESKEINHRCDIELKRPCGSVLKVNGLPISVVTSLIPSFVN